MIIIVHPVLPDTREKTPNKTAVGKQYFCGYQNKSPSDNIIPSLPLSAFKGREEEESQAGGQMHQPNQPANSKSRQTISRLSSPSTTVLVFTAAEATLPPLCHPSSQYQPARPSGNPRSRRVHTTRRRVTPPHSDIKSPSHFPFRFQKGGVSIEADQAGTSLTISLHQIHHHRPLIMPLSHLVVRNGYRIAYFCLRCNIAHKPPKQMNHQGMRASVKEIDLIYSCAW